MGTDTLQYSIIYKGLQTWSDFIYLEPSFRGLVIFSHYLGLNLSGFYILMSALTLLPVLYVTTKSRFSLVFFYYLSVFFFPYMINGIRQSLAMGLGMIAIYIFNKGNKKKALVLTVIAASFHFGALIYFLYFILSSISRKLCLIIIGFVLLFFLKWGLDVFGPGSSSIGSFDVLYRTVLIIILSLFVSKENESLLIFYITGFLIYLSLYFDAQLAARVHFYFRIIEILIFATPLKNITLSKSTTTILTIFFLFWNLIIYV